MALTVMAKEDLEKWKTEYAAKGEIRVPIGNLDDLPRISSALDLTSYRVHRDQRGLARKYGISKSTAKKFLKAGWLELQVKRISNYAAEYELYCTSWIPVARAQVMAENGGCGYGPYYEYDGDSSKVSRYVYEFGTNEQITLMETLMKRIMATESLPFMIYHRLSLCLLKKYDNAWFQTHWGQRHEWGFGTEALDSWVDVSPMEHMKASAIFDEFHQACLDAAEAYIASHPKDGGYCGFGWVNVPCNEPFGKWLVRQKQEDPEFPGHSGGAYYSMSANVPARMSLDYKEQVYYAGMAVLRKHSIKHVPDFQAD